ncbi:glycosyl hydrolase family 10 [Bacteroides stercoris]|jgi:endo-1,4-beta-xylanase|uniref:endo-1,4-beta-xylanase n=1 Tax=Bacteroides stercoris TaxID=46506 RepID=A0A3E4UU82_BACSE|nr:endo-1,4-beta-xylanase [Bacteroides stercoris]RGM15986.1 glycosyl hydrolase family 10 [Bacteroides stercoris]RGR26069.1 glycosyl hydrolase family 10 [Bacteroides stercoris]RGR38480.1 glycosyl hydrolase family 10 [Bacteroides stercoris]
MIMKNSINKYFGLALLFISASCADDKFVDFKTEKPESIAQYEYLNAYDALKTYIDRSTHPNFKLGVGVAANDFLKGEMVRSVAVANFDEVVAGNVMKYASIVADDGSMDFGTVTKFVEAAKTSGLTVYGHTLCWHSQQNNKWLNSLIANKPKPVDPSSVNRVLHIVAGEPKDNVWDWEIYYDLDNVLEIGKQYTLTLRIKGSNPGAFSFWPGMKDGSNTHYGFPECTSGEGWIDNTIVFTPTSSIDRLRFCFGKLGGDLYFDDVVLKADGSEANLLVNSSFDEDDISHWTTVSWMGLSYGVEELGESGSTVWFESIITNGDAEGEDVSCFYATEDGKGGPYAAPIGETGTGADGVGRAFIVKSADNPAEDHSTQFFVKANTVLKEGDICKLSFKYKADKAAGSDSQTHKKPGEYIFYDAGVSVNFTTQWQKFEKEFTVTEQMVTNEGVQPFQTIAWNLAKFKEANTYYFDDIEFGIQKKAEGIPLTPEEKKEVLTNELERWIKGMMEACGGSVTAWDVVNEPISGGGDDGNGNYALQSATNPDDNGVGGQNFYWQDFLGDDYVRIPIKFARKYFAENGGNSGDLKLFINDYNLESWWDNNKKVKSLINWIKRWESDGETKIDGIGTQMHVSYILNEADQKKQEESIVNMFELLAASGKLIKITELDMGIVEKAFGEGIKTELVTFEQYQKMSDFYKFIIQKYFEIIPVAQQYGITQWAATDSPADSGWRKGQPIGLWDLNYNRKHTYAGFADGLAGK